MSRLLEVEGLTVRYGPIVAVREASLAVETGEVVALLGPNGAGKSSTLGAIMGVVPPALGAVRFEGHEITGRRPEEIVRRGLALTPEGRRVFPALTVEENLGLGAAARRDRDGIAADLGRALELFPVLRERLRQAAGTLSGGEQQQLSMARSLMGAPRMLLLDEPSLGLAPRYVDLVFDLVARLRAERGLTILLVEQNVDRALRVSDRAYVLSTGRIELEGRSDQLLRGSDIERSYLGIGARA